MLVLQVVQKNLSFMGYSRNERAFNRKHIVISLQMALDAISKAIYLIYFANTPKERMEITFHTTVSLLIFITFVSTIFKMEFFFTCTDIIQLFVNESKSNANLIIMDLLLISAKSWIMSKVTDRIRL